MFVLTGLICVVVNWLDCSISCQHSYKRAFVALHSCSINGTNNCIYIVLEISTCEDAASTPCTVEVGGCLGLMQEALVQTASLLIDLGDLAALSVYNYSLVCMYYESYTHSLPSSTGGRH